MAAKRFNHKQQNQQIESQGNHLNANVKAMASSSTQSKWPKGTFILYLLQEKVLHH